MAVRDLGATARDSVLSVDRRTLLGVALAALAGLIVLALTQPAATSPVLVAGADLEAGVPLGELALVVRHVETTEGLVIGDSVGDLADWSLRGPIAAGEPLIPSMLVPPQLSAAGSLVSVAVERDHAALGAVGPGDVVDLYLTTAVGLGEKTTTLLAADVFVVETSVPTTGLSQNTISLLLGVDDDLAGRIAAASRAGDLDIVKKLP